MQDWRITSATRRIKQEGRYQGEEEKSLHGYPGIRTGLVDDYSRISRLSASTSG